MKTKYRIVGTKATPFGGLFFISEMLEQLSLDQAFDEATNRLFRPTQHCMTTWSGSVGGKRLLSGRTGKLPYTVAQGGLRYD
jgi:hypothetical protein